MLLKNENVYTTYHVIKLLDRKEFDKVNINVLIEKWMHVMHYGYLEKIKENIV
jgi:hypothetical protein